MKKLPKNLIDRTYVRYFFSYLIIFTVLILGFFLIVRNQIADRYFQQLSEQSEFQLDNLAAQFDDELVSLFQIDNSLEKNINLIRSRYQLENWTNYQTFVELQKYAASSSLISSICYMSTNSNTITSTLYSVNYVDGQFCIVKENGSSVFFDPQPYFNSFSSQLIFSTDDDTQFLIYFPSINEKANYIYFYLLDVSDIQQQIKSITSDTIPAAAFIDANRQIVTAVNSELLLPYIDSFELKDGIYEIDASKSICVHTGISNGFSMISLISNDSLICQINKSFATAYATLLILGLLGLFLVLFAMRITYFPLKKLTKKILPDADQHSSYLEQLDFAFSNAEEQNLQLQRKLDHYRLSIRKSLFDSLFTTSNANVSEEFPNIDEFFNAASCNEIFVIRLGSSERPLICRNIQQYFEEMLPGKDSCIILESEEKSATFLINYSGTEINKKEVLKELLTSLYTEQGYLSAISSGSNSPLDIPSLYESANHASEYWPDIPVVDEQAIPPASSALAYPHDRLGQLAEALKKHDFSLAHSLLNSLFLTIEQSISADMIFPDFFVRSILTDILTIVIEKMNQAKLKTTSYYELYLETLTFCRNQPYAQNAEKITTNIHKLLSIYEETVSNKIVNPTQLKQLIEESFSQPDFSIAILADKYHVSIAYMSYLFKKELNQNFSDYLWSVRLEKAKQLLSETDLSIDEISVAVGYLNTSSLRRKFKQETGLTPFQYRNQRKHCAE